MAPGLAGACNMILRGTNAACKVSGDAVVEALGVSDFLYRQTLVNSSSWAQACDNSFAHAQASSFRSFFGGIVIVMAHTIIIFYWAKYQQMSAVLPKRLRDEIHRYSTDSKPLLIQRSKGRADLEQSYMLKSVHYDPGSWMNAPKEKDMARERGGGARAAAPATSSNQLGGNNANNQRSVDPLTHFNSEKPSASHKAPRKY
jgi:hypothetical protein